MKLQQQDLTQPPYRPCACDVIVHSQPRSAGNVPPYWVSCGMLLTHAFTV